MTTYWLYSNGEPIQSVRESDAQSENTIRGIAIGHAQRNPGIFVPAGQLLEQHLGRLRYATVRVFPGGN